MAQAAVTPQPRFFCHECRDEVPINTETQTCTRCNGGFVEEMETSNTAAGPPPGRPATRGAGATAGGGGGGGFAGLGPTDPAAAFAEMLAQGLLDPLRNMGGVTTTTGTTHGYNTRQASRQQQASTEPADTDDEGGEMGGIAPNVHIHFNHPTAGERPFQGIMNLVLQRLTSDLGGGGQFLQLHGNPGDYAWGTAGLDTIITQLFNQIDPGSGAPPADEATINNLPKVTIEQTHIDAGAQCSICMDDFELSQTVRKLPCDHLYHLDCIKKWLEMHGTCPVCRKDMNGKIPASSQDEDGHAMDLSNAGSSVS